MGIPQANEGDNGQAPLSILEKLGLLADLQSEFAKAINEQENIKQRHRRELADVASRRQGYADAILAAMRELNDPALTEEGSTNSSSLPRPSATLPTAGEPKGAQGQEQGSPANDHSEHEEDRKEDEQDQKTGLPVGQDGLPRFEKRGVLKKAILQVFQEQDAFLTADEVIELMKKRYPNNGLSRSKITDSLKDARTSVLVGHRVFQGRLPTYLNGLPAFYTSVEHKEIKPEYVDKYLEKMIGLGLTDTVEPTITEQSNASAKAPGSSLFPLVAPEGAEQKTAPVKTGAE